MFFVLSAEALLFMGSPITKVVFYLVTSFLFFYLLFSRYACRILLYEDEIYVRYFFFWEKNTCVLLNKVQGVDYRKGFYDFIDDKSLGGLYSFPKYCYDEIIIKKMSGEFELHVNTMLFSFNKLISNINTTIKNTRDKEKCL